MTCHVSRLMTSRLSNVFDKATNSGNRTDSGNMTAYICDGECNYPKTERRAGNYFHVREEKDPFPDLSIVDLLDVDQKDDIHLGLVDLLRTAYRNDVSQQYQAERSQLV